MCRRRERIYGLDYFFGQPAHAERGGSCQELSEQERASGDGTACVRLSGFCGTSGGTGTGYDYAERRRADMTRRLNDLYDQIYKAEDLLQESLMKKATLESEQMSVQSMIGILSSFDAISDRMNAAERRDLVKYLISEVELFPREEQKTQKRFVRAIAYKFPIEQKVLTQFDECGASIETVCLLEREKLAVHINMDVDAGQPVQDNGQDHK